MYGFFFLVELLGTTAVYVIFYPQFHTDQVKKLAIQHIFVERKEGIRGGEKER